MLKVEGINVYYGNIQALKGVSLEINQGEIVTLIGANGAGKSTLLKTISGLLKPKQGQIIYEGQSIAGKAAQSIVKMGISHVPEGRRVFANMTVEENLDLGAYLRKDKEGIKEDFGRVFELFPRLMERRKQLAGTLSGGEQQMLAIGRGLMSDPELLMLDEPTLGLSPKLALHMLSSLTQMRKQGITLLLVSQEILQCLKIAERAYVLENGRITVEGTSAELLSSESIKKAYLGI